MKETARRLIGTGRRVVEFGCGTGDVLAALEPAWGLGIDSSDGMLEIARRKRAADPSLSFSRPEEVALPLAPPPDAILLADVVEHIEDAEGLVRFLRSLCGPATRVVVLMANPLWTPVLRALEILRLKMPEGPHRRRSYRWWRRRFEAAGFAAGPRGRRCLVPHPAFDRWNRAAEGWPLLSRLALIEHFEFRPA